MAKGKELATTSFSDYEIMKSGPAQIGKLLAENLGEGEELSDFDIERMKFPSGGIPVFARTTDQGTETMDHIDGVILYAGRRRVYWDKKYGQGESGPPSCSSMDGLTGTGRIRGDAEDKRFERRCKTCPMSKYGSALKDDGSPAKGQACQERKLIFLAVADSILPMCVSIPPSSLKKYKSYALALTTKNKSIMGVVTRIKLKTEKNEGGTEYAEAEFERVEDLTDEQAKQLGEMAQSLASVFKSAGIEEEDESDEPKPVQATVEREVVEQG